MIKVPRESWSQLISFFQLQRAPQVSHLSQLRRQQQLPILFNFLVSPVQLQTQTRNHLQHVSEQSDTRRYAVYSEICPYCLNVDSFRIHHQEGAIICVECGYIDDFFQDQESFTHLVGPVLQNSIWGARHRRQRSYEFCWKRTQHFRAWLNRIQAFHSSIINQKECLALKEFMEKRHMDCQDLASIREAIRLQKKAFLYTKIFYLQSLFSDHQIAIRLTRQQIKTLEALFESIQDSFRRYGLAYRSRQNMLSYAYLLRKFAELLEWDDLASTMPLLKSVEHIRSQDVIWKFICNDLHFPFIPTV